MDNDYYSLTAILSENHKLPCTFALDVPGLGYLEGTDNDLRAGAKLELPMWLGQTLTLNDFVQFSPPAPFSRRVYAALKASAPSVRLSGFVGTGGWWYRFGTRIAHMWDNGGDELLQTLLKAFTGRLPPLHDLASHHASLDTTIECGSGTGEAFRDGMEADERDLFSIGQDSGKVVKAWYDTTWGRRERSR
ncbi:DNA replication protein [Apiotrichum porosum]|uniref:DNA replication complex GINS protein PSF3 n=1 Tax=Apiotrichum porosum TaxID=105984 RepID=A0A427XXC3_9TREE|nr:DNA replication protein [Apiotrichum porosum]RSH83375.1 DNA replication protein [Apiotrichum porosum]